MAHTIDKSSNFIKVTYSQTLTNDDIQEVVKYSVSCPDFANRIEDMRNIENVNIGFKELLSLSLSLQDMELPHTVKSAILTSHQLHYGFARMFQTILNHPQIKIEVFSNEEEARKWLASGD